MTTVGRAVLSADHDVGMYDGHAVFERRVPDQRQKLDLFVEGHRPFVLLGVPTEPAQLHRGQGTDGREAGRRQVLVLREMLETAG